MEQWAQEAPQDATDNTRSWLTTRLRNSMFCEAMSRPRGLRSQFCDLGVWAAVLDLDPCYGKNSANESTHHCPPLFSTVPRHRLPCLIDRAGNQTSDARSRYPLRLNSFSVTFPLAFHYPSILIKGTVTAAAPVVLPCDNSPFPHRHFSWHPDFSEPYHLSWAPSAD